MEDKIPQDIKIITDCALRLGWSFAVPKGGGVEDDGEVHGMIIGELAYIKYILKHLE